MSKSNDDVRQHTYYFLNRIQLGSGCAALRSFTSDHQQWSLVRADLQEVMQLFEDDGSSLWAQVIANLRVEEYKKKRNSNQEWSERSRIMPFVNRNTSL